jgi:phosphoglycolate phosphatase
MKKLIIFDLDGTLLDTIEDLANSVNYALKLNNFETHPISAYNFFIGSGLNKLLERALPADKQNADMVSMLKVDFIKHYSQHAEEFTKPYAGVLLLLKNLASKGCQLAIASNKYHTATVELVKRFFPDIEFCAVFGQRDGHPVKPNPGILEEIIEIAGVNKSEVLYVGDSGVDVATAYNTKVDFVGVLWGFRPRKELEEVGAEIFVENTEELQKCIFEESCV